MYAGDEKTTPVILGSGSKLGNYEIEAPAGTGGMGEVYAARDTPRGRCLPDVRDYDVWIYGSGRGALTRWQR